MLPADLEEANQWMVDRLIAEGTLWSPQLIAAFRATPRHAFLDRAFVYKRRAGSWREILLREPDPEGTELIYSDRALITHVSETLPEAPSVAISSSSQPSLMAQMLEDLRPRSGQRILEVGAGTGYNAALLAHVAGPGQVTSVDVDRNVLSEAWDHLRKFPDRQVDLKHADGREGYADHAPFDRIMVTAATPDLEPAWLEQLAPDGILIAPLALAPGLAFIVRGGMEDGQFRGRLTRAAYFMPLRAEGETGRETDSSAPLPGALQTVPAPWAGWFETHVTHRSWTEFLQALAFHAWLHGLEIHYQTLAMGETAYGVAQEDQVCWLGSESWHVTGDQGQELGHWLWRSFLDAGGPGPTAYRLTVGSDREDAEPQARRFLRRGPRFVQVWERAV